MEQTTHPAPRDANQKEYRLQENPKATGRWIGTLLLAAFALYGAGARLMEQATSDRATTDEILTTQMQLRTGALLIVANSIAIVAIGVLMYRLATRAVERHVRLAYMGSRLFESVFLALGAVFALPLLAAAESPNDKLVHVLTEGGSMAYQIGMIGLCAGSIPLFLALMNSQAMPLWLGLWGVAGYAIFGVGAALEILGMPAGVILSIPGGIFEITFAAFLIRNGALRQSTEPTGTSSAAIHVGAD